MRIENNGHPNTKNKFKEKKEAAKEAAALFREDLRTSFLWEKK